MARGGAAEWRPLTAAEAECPVCGWTLEEPARLPCGHRFCLGCVKGAVAHGAGRCPLCRARCSGWLRRATLDRTLVDEPLWRHIRANFPGRTEDRLSGSEKAVRHQISAPGEIKNEFEAELERLRNERRLLDEKYSKENEKLIKELQDQEKRELELHTSTIERDERLARELSNSLNNSAVEPQPTSTRSLDKTASKEFYDHLEKTMNGRRPKTLDRYVLRSDEKSANVERNFSNTTNSATMTATSPELISTAGRCGRFLRNFLNGRLWGFKPESEGTPHSGTSSKIEPKTWEPQKIYYNGDRELSVNSGIVIQRNTATLGSVKLDKFIGSDTRPRIDSDIESEDSLSQELWYIKPIQPSPVSRFTGKIVRTLAIKNVPGVVPHTLNETVPDKLLFIDALEKLKRIQISDSGFSSAFVCYLTIPESHVKVYKTSTIQPSKLPIKKTNNKKSNINVKKSISCNFVVNNDKSQKAKTKNNSTKRNGLIADFSTPKKTSPTRRSNRLSHTFPKSNCNNIHHQNRTSLRIKRNISFDEKSQSKSSIDEIYTNGDIINKDIEEASSNCTNFDNHRKLKNNGHLKKNNCSVEENSIAKTKHKTSNHNGKSNGKPEFEVYGNGVKSRNGVDFPVDNIDPSILQEQKRIEEMIAQEKKDLALAKKLQRQLGGQVINTGYTLRTAAKRQATLTELLPPSKNMRI